MTISVADGLRIEQIEDAKSGTKWIASSHPLFAVVQKDGTLSSIDCDVGEVSWSKNSCEMSLSPRHKNSPFEFTIRICEGQYGELVAEVESRNKSHEEVDFLLTPTLISQEGLLKGLRMASLTFSPEKDFTWPGKLSVDGNPPINVLVPVDCVGLVFCGIWSPARDIGISVLSKASFEPDDEMRVPGRPLPPQADLEVRKLRKPLPAGQSRTYDIHVDAHRGAWQEALDLHVRKRYCYAVKEYDRHLYDRQDLHWIRQSYITCVMYSYDHDFYDASKKGYQLGKFLEEGKKLFGGCDVYVTWPTWPRLGIDERNQWDYYRDLPGGLERIRRVVEMTHSRGTRFFIAYNPWDNGTRPEDHVEGMKSILGAINGDGVILDTMERSTPEFQQGVDKVRPGILFYPEGLPSMDASQTIIAGRVHDSIFLEPVLNLSKFAIPEHAVFRVCRLGEARIHRNICVSFFNGHGVELLNFLPTRAPGHREDLLFLGKAVRILRENSKSFTSLDWKPLIDSNCEGIHINRWPFHAKTVYTIYSSRPEGYRGALFNVDVRNNVHYVDLWNHEEKPSHYRAGVRTIECSIDRFNPEDVKTRMEGMIGCIGEFPNLLDIDVTEKELVIRLQDVDPNWHIKVNTPRTLHEGTGIAFSAKDLSEVRLADIGNANQKIIVQLFDEDGELLDEKPILPASESRTEPASIPEEPFHGIHAVSEFKKSSLADPRRIPEDMTLIPRTTFQMKVTHQDQFPPCYDHSEPRAVTVGPFLIDRFKITNRQFKVFLDSTGYRPSETRNFLKHWKDGTFPEGMADHPAVNVSIEDAREYAQWCGKRLATEEEWHLAAQGTDGRKWPWGNEFDAQKCNSESSGTTPVDRYPDGRSPFGCYDMSGNVWEWVEPVYDDGHHYFSVVRGGSHYAAKRSIWYIEGGAKPCDHHQRMFLMYPGLDRCSTVGFRCVKDLANIETAPDE